jgi:DNA repair protein RadC
MQLKPYKPTEFKVLTVRECQAMTELADTPDLVAAYWRNNIPQADWFDPAKEAFVVLILNTRRRVLGHNLVALGSLDTCPVTPLHVFRPAIAVAGSAIILMHNHPSGDPTPSHADIKVTGDLVRAGDLLKIEILDHIVVGKDTHASLRSLGYFY